MSGMRFLSIGRCVVVAAAALSLGACGQNRGLPPAGPLKAEWYVIDENDRPLPGQFLRYAAPGPSGGGLDIAITDYEPADQGPTVHLVGVVHVADGPYYEAMQRELDACATVLYEGVKPSEMDGARWQKSMLETTGDLGQLQKEIADWFAFRYQMEAIDYSRPNLVHADMSMEEFAKAGGERLGLVPKQSAESKPATESKEAASSEMEDDVGLGSTSSRSSASNQKVATAAVMETWTKVRGLAHVALGEGGPLQSLGRQMFAQTMGTQDIGTALDFVPGLSELLLNKRNEVVIRTLEVERKKATGRIAIFYGAAHMKDLEKRLVALNYRRTGGRWLRAWALRPPIK